MLDAGWFLFVPSGRGGLQGLTDQDDILVEVLATALDRLGRQALIGKIDELWLAEAEAKAEATSERNTISIIGRVEA